MQSQLSLIFLMLVSESRNTPMCDAPYHSIF